LPVLARKLTRKTFPKFYPPPTGIISYKKNKKCLESSDLARKLIKKTF
jgi:hypothetical protein